MPNILIDLSVYLADLDAQLAYEAESFQDLGLAAAPLDRPPSAALSGETRYFGEPAVHEEFWIFVTPATQQVQISRCHES